MITLSYLKSHWKDILHFCSFHGLGISELIQGVLTCQKRGWGDQATGSSLCLSPNRHPDPGGTLVPVSASLCSGSSHIWNHCFVYYVFNKQGRVQGWKIRMGIEFRQGYVRSPCWGILCKKNTLLATLFMRGQLNKAPQGCPVGFH